MKSLGIIPARYASTRFPGKPLVKIKGKEMILHTIGNALNSGLDKVIVATDDERIFACVKKAGYEVEMTSTKHQSGTDRIAEVANKFPEYDLLVNIQGDEPFVSEKHINPILNLLRQGKEITSLSIPINSINDLNNPNKVKVVMGENGNALYFSRQALPFQRDVEFKDWLINKSYYKHIGMYGFQRETLLKLTQLPLSNLEKLEKLEQLRWLENGYSIAMHITDFESLNVDTPEDLNQFAD
jgi:3-deoxy-manno-octulosonate cytidylyltransferase (CMP-KDO synthetase)